MNNKPFEKDPQPLLPTIEWRDRGRFLNDANVNNDKASIEEELKSDVDSAKALQQNILNEAEATQDTITEELTKKFFDEVVNNAESIPHDPKFPFITWYAEHLKKWRECNPNATFEDWIIENNKQVQHNRKWKEGFGITSVILGIGVGIAVAFGAPVWLAAFAAIAALINGVISIWKGAQLNRYIEGRSYLLKNMEDKMHHMIADLNKKIDILPDGDEKNTANEKHSIVIKKMKQFKKDHYKASVFFKKWGSMGLRQGVGYAISAARLILGLLVIVGVVASLPLGATLGLLAASLLCEVIGFALYRASHNERDRMMSNNGKQIHNTLTHCMDLQKQYGTVKKEDGIEQKGLKNIDDLNNLHLLNKDDAKKQLNKIDGLKHECKHNHHHKKKCNHKHTHEHDCKANDAHTHQEENTIPLQNLLMNKSQLNHTHIHYPKGCLGKPVTLYSNITQGVSKGISKCLEKKQNKVAPIQNIMN